jgi:hypothetical protein
MGSDRHKMEADRKAKVDADAVTRRAKETQVLEGADGLSSLASVCDPSRSVRLIRSHDLGC